MTKQKPFENRIHDAFYGVTLSDKYLYCDKHITFSGLENILGLKEPPIYIVKCVLEINFGVIKFEGTPGQIKSWRYPVIYKNKRFVISDIFNSLWGIFGEKGSIVEANELSRKVIASSKLLDGHIKELSRNAFNNEGFSLSNTYPRTSDFYLYFYNLEIEKLKSQDESNDDVTKSLEDFGFHAYMLRKQLETTEIDALTVATSSLFFALNDIILDACFALSDRFELTFPEFRSMKLKDRLSLFIDLNRSDIAETYKEINHAKSHYRNYPLHANPTYLFDLKGVGLIPATYATLYDPNMEHMNEFHENGIGLRNIRCKSILQAFSRWLEILSSIDETKYGFIYASSGYPIHISNTKAQILRDKRKSESEFKDTLVTMKHDSKTP